MKLHFTKMQAYGNDYIYVDAIHETLPEDLPALARKLSDHHYGVGSDGMVLICPSESADFRMRIFNPDGSEAEMCGNASRSVGKYVYDHGLTSKTQVALETLSGIKQLYLTVENGTVSNICADIGQPIWDPALIPVCTDKAYFVNEPVEVLGRQFLLTAVSWGNPHCVAFLDEDLADFDVHGYGKALEHKTELFPNKTNVTFARMISRQEISMREWERNCGETIGCGTGCCTAAVAAMRLGHCDRRVTVQQIGGPLLVEWEEETGAVFMTGPSHYIFEADIEV